MGVGGQRYIAAALSPGKIPCTHFTIGWLGPRASLDGWGKSRAHQNLIPGFSSS